MAVYSYALWTLQRPGDIREANGDRPTGSHIRIMSCVLRRRDRNWPHFPGTPAQPAESVSAIQRSPPNTKSGEVSTLAKGGDAPLGYSGRTALRREQCDVLPKSLKAIYRKQHCSLDNGLGERLPHNEPRQRNWLEAFSAATELFGEVSSIQAAKTLLKAESAEKSDTHRIPDYRALQKTSREYSTEKGVQGIRQFYNRPCAMEIL
jgi:hypothetical protein